MNNAPVEKVVVTVLNRQVVLDPENMKYNENSLGDYMGREYGWIDYFGKQLEYAQKEALLAEIDADAQYSLKYMECKDAGNTDNYAKAFATAHVDVVAAKKKVVDRKEAVGHLKAHLKAWSENHENVKSRSYTLNQEMNKLNRDIYQSDDSNNTCSAEDVLNELRK